jgi:hypothetical protein
MNNEEWRNWNPEYFTRTETVYRRERREDVLCRTHYAHYWQPAPGVWVTRLVGIEELAMTAHLAA